VQRSKVQETDAVEEVSWFQVVKASVSTSGICTFLKEPLHFLLILNPRALSLLSGHQCCFKPPITASGQLKTSVSSRLASSPIASTPLLFCGLIPHSHHPCKGQGGSMISFLRRAEILTDRCGRSRLIPRAICETCPHSEMWLR
jgi:hypothetical protein